MDSFHFDVLDHVPPRHDSFALFPSSRDNKVKNTRPLLTKLTPSPVFNHAAPSSKSALKPTPDIEHTSLSAPEWSFARPSLDDTHLNQNFTAPVKSKGRATYAAVSSAFSSITGLESNNRNVFRPFPLKFRSSRRSQDVFSKKASGHIRSSSSLQPLLQIETLTTLRVSKDPSIRSLTESILHDIDSPKTGRSPTSSLDVSSFLLTLFPSPPHNHQTSIQESSNGSRDLDEPHTPSVHSHQSAALDIFELYASPPVNISKLLQENVSRQGSLSSTISKADVIKPQKAAIMSQQLLKTGHSDEANSQSSQGRTQLYSDLASAYKNITSRSFSESMGLDLPLPPVPVPTRTRLSKIDDVHMSTSDDDMLTPRESLSYISQEASLQEPYAGGVDVHENIIDVSPLAHRQGLAASQIALMSHYGRPKSAPTGSLLSLTETLSSKFSIGPTYYDDESDEDDDGHEIKLRQDFPSDTTEMDGDEEKFVLMRRHSEMEMLRAPWPERETVSAASTIDNIIDAYIRPAESAPALTSQNLVQIAASKSVPIMTEEGHSHNLNPFRKSVGPTSKPLLTDKREDAQLGNLKNITLSSANLDYGETQDLLRQSSSPKYYHHPGHSSLHSLVKSPVSASENDLMNAKGQAHSNMQLITGDNDESNPGNAERFSELSNVSDLDGAKYFLKKAFMEDAKKPVEPQVIRLKEPVSAQFTESSTKPASGRSRAGTQTSTPTKIYEEVARFPRSADLPSVWRHPQVERANFEKSARSSKFSPVSKLPRYPQSESEDGKEESDIDEEDWETTNSRPTLHSLMPQGESVAGVSSSSSFNISGLPVHPADTRFEHVYSPKAMNHSNKPVLTPTYNFGQSFPNRNALVSPTPSINTPPYNAPAPLTPTHTNPFRSSPPSLLKAPPKSSPPARVSFSTTSSRPVITSPLARSEVAASQHVKSQVGTPTTPEHPLRSWHKKTLSVVPEHVDETPHQVKRFFQKNKKSIPSVGRIVSAKSKGGSSVTGKGPAPIRDPWLELVTFDKTAAQLRSEELIMQALRAEDTRMASTPLSRSNSFNQFSYLGPLSNITGSPSGTGMREVGSSTVGSSSAQHQFTSSPPVAQSNLIQTPPSTGKSEVESSVVTRGRNPYQFTSSAPLIQGSLAPQYLHRFKSAPPVAPPELIQSPRHAVLRSKSLAIDPDSPLAQYDERKYGISIRDYDRVVSGPAVPEPAVTRFSVPEPPVVGLSFPGPTDIELSVPEPAVPKRERNFIETMLLASRSEDNLIRSVPSQTQLFPMHLMPGYGLDHSNGGSSVGDPYDTSDYRGDSRGTDRPLLPVAERRVFVPPGLPRRPPPSHASGLDTLQTIISWFCFAIVGILPPLLLLYGYGQFDQMMVYLSKGRIEHFGRTQKRLSKWVGTSATVATVFGIIIYVIVKQHERNEQSL